MKPLIMARKYNQNETEKLVEKLWSELEWKLVKSIFEEFKLDKSCAFLILEELREGSSV